MTDFDTPTPATDPAVQRQNQEEMRQQWLAQRRLGAGGSDIAAILGLSPFKTAFQLWLEKTGRDEGQIKDNERMAWGRRLEKSILDDWQDRHGRLLDRGRCVVHPTCSIISATLDGSTADLSVVVEAKNVDTTPAAAQPYYEVQVLWEMAASGAQTGYLTELVRGHEIVEFVFRLEDYAARIQEIIDIVQDWWAKHVIADVPPDPLAADVRRIARLYPEVDAAAVAEIPEDLVRDYLKEKEAVEAAEMRRDAIQTKIQMLMGPAKIGKSAAGKVSWYQVGGRASIDAKALAKVHPAIAEQFTTHGANYRVFKVS